MTDPLQAVFDPDRREGLTKREWFAGIAMQGLLTGAVGFIGSNLCPSAYAAGPCNAEVAERAVAMADNLIRALNDWKE